jgi:hypothetical protein
VLIAKGLQCHTSQFTWKLIFHADGREYEILLSACSEREEETWKAQLGDRIGIETTEFANWGDSHDLLSKNFEDIKSLGPEFVPSTSVSRTLSIRRSATIHPKSGTQQVIIKGTEAQKCRSPTSSLTVVRSQSHMSSSHIPILAPRREERITLEDALIDVWTKQSLKYPGMPRRGDNSIRASANSVMRKLSIASVASNLSKRSMSHTALSNHRVKDGYAPSTGSCHAMRARQVSDTKKHRVVDFHTAPSTFLPDDFELNIKLSRRARKVSARLSIHDAAGAVSKTKSAAAATESLPIQVNEATNRVAKTTMHVVDAEDEKSAQAASKSPQARTESPIGCVDVNEKRPGSAGPATRRLVMARGLFRLFK